MNNNNNNNPSGYADHSRKAFQGAQLVHVPVVHNPDAESFQRYGRYVVHDMNKLRENVYTTVEGAEIAHGEFVVRRDGESIRAKNNGIKADEYTTGLAVEEEAVEEKFLTREVNKHPTSEQLFAPLEGQPFALLLAASDIPTEKLRAEDLRLFKFDGSRSVTINVDTWHQPPYGYGRFYTAQAASHECECVDFLDRDNVALVLDLS
ncbi:hypothetical protein QOT17_004099 [Balamuthia mandrillaris]